MIGRKRVLRVAAVLSVAVAAGHVVETLRVSADSLADLREVSSTDLIALATPSVRVPGASMLASGARVELPSLVGITPVAASTDGRPNDDCAASLALAPSADAMIDVALSAPCGAGQRVVIRHSGLSFTGQIGPDGQLALQLPALTAEAMVSAYFEDSQVALANVSVPEVAGKVRFAFQMGYPARFDMRAAEDGQVYAASSGLSLLGGTRPIVTLGSTLVSQPILAQVYTFPTASLSTADLTVEVRITDETCSRTFMAEVMTSVAGNITATALPVALPLCGTSGDILVLKNLVTAPTLATP